MIGSPAKMSDILGMNAARRLRAQRRARDNVLAVQTTQGLHFPTTEQLLRGFPFFRGVLARDMEEFAARLDVLSAGAKDSERVPTLCRLARGLANVNHLHAVDELTSLLITDAAVAAIAGGPEAILRCRIYAAHLGVDLAAQEVATASLTRALAQDWHLEGDGSDLVWQSLGWLAYCGQSEMVRLNPELAISLMDTPSERVMANADEFRLRVERCVFEIAQAESSFEAI